MSRGNADRALDAALDARRGGQVVASRAQNFRDQDRGRRDRDQDRRADSKKKHRKRSSSSSVVMRGSASSHVSLGTCPAYRWVPTGAEGLCHVVGVGAAE